MYFDDFDIMIGCIFSFFCFQQTEYFLFIFLVTSIWCVILVRLECRDICENSVINEKKSKNDIIWSWVCLLTFTKWSTNLDFIVIVLHSKWHLSMKKTTHVITHFYHNHEYNVHPWPFFTIKSPSKYVVGMLFQLICL